MNEEEILIQAFQYLQEDDEQGLLSVLGESFDPNIMMTFVPQDQFIFGKIPCPFLNIAASCGSQNCVDMFLEAGADPNIVDDNGNTPIISAAYSGFVSIAESLINAGADPNAVNNEEYHAIHFAAQFGNTDYLQYVLTQSTFVIDTPTTYNETALMLACKKGYIQTVEFLVKSGASVTKVDSFANTPIHIAIQNGAIEVAAALIEHTSFPINTPNNDMHTVLHESALTGDLELFQLILSKGGNPKAVDRERNTVLHFAAISRSFFLLDFILKSRFVDVNALNSKKYAALHYASAYGPIDNVKALLLESPNMLNNYESGYPPIYLAVKHHHTDIVQLLLSHVSFDPSPIAPGYVSPIHIACRIPNAELLNALIESHYFDLSVPDSNGWSPIHYAASKGSLVCVRLLVEAGCDVTMTTSDGETALNILERRGSRNIYQYLCSLNPEE